jgi:hemerythrin-like domain-containing protein
MAIQIGAKPDAGFDDPLGMLKDCHRRIENFLRILCTVAKKAAPNALTLEETEAVKAALNYFQTGGVRHNADEEESLFPRMRAASAGEIEQIAGLESEHRDASKLHADVERLYRAWLGQGALSEGDAGELRTATQRLGALYAEHIEMEEKVVFPRAAKVLDREAIAAMGTEFRARRR